MGRPKIKSAFEKIFPTTTNLKLAKIENLTKKIEVNISFFIIGHLFKII
jgi:hypothetical protein